MLSADEVARLIGADEVGLEASGALSVARDETLWYPGFQFSGTAVRADWPELTQPLIQAGWEPEEVLLWFAAPTGWLRGRAPVDLLDTAPSEVRVAVTQAALGPVD